MTEKVKIRVLFCFVFFLVLSFGLGAVFVRAEESVPETTVKWQPSEIGKLSFDEESELNRMQGRTVIEARDVDLTKEFSFGFISHYADFMSGTSVNQIRIEILDQSERNGIRVRSGFSEGIQSVKHNVHVSYLVDGKYIASPKNISVLSQMSDTDQKGNFFSFRQGENRFYLQVGSYNYSKDYLNVPDSVAPLFQMDMSAMKVKITSYTATFSDAEGYCLITDGYISGGVRVLGETVKDWSSISNADIPFILNRSDTLPRISYKGEMLTPNNYTFLGDRIYIKNYFLAGLSNGAHIFSVCNEEGSLTDITLTVNIVSGTAFQTEHWSGVTDGEIQEDSGELNASRFKSMAATYEQPFDFDLGCRVDFKLESKADTITDVFYVTIMQGDIGISITFDGRTSAAEVLYTLSDGTQDVPSNYMTVNDLHGQHYISVEKTAPCRFEIVVDGIRSLPVALREDISLQNAIVSFYVGTAEESEFRFKGTRESVQYKFKDWITLNGSQEKINADGSSTFLLNERRFEGTGDAYSRERLISVNSYDVTQPIVIAGSMNWAELDLDSWLISFSDSQYGDLNIDQPAIWQGASENHFDFLICRPGFGVINLKTNSSTYLTCLTYTDNSKMKPYEKLDDLNVYRFDIGAESTTLTVNGTAVLNGINIKQSDFASGRAYITIAFLSRLKGNRIGPEEFTVRPVNSVNVALNQERTYELQSKYNFNYPMTNLTEDVLLYMDGVRIDEKYYGLDVSKNRIEFIGESADELFAGKEAGKYVIQAVPGEDFTRAANLVLNIRAADLGYQGDLSYGDGDISPLSGNIPIATIAVVCSVSVVAIAAAVFLVVLFKKRRKKS